MTEKEMFGSLSVDLGTRTHLSAMQVQDGAKARIGLIGNFRGNTSSDQSVGSDQTLVDIDTFENVFKKLNVSWSGQIGSLNQTVSIEFNSPEDFEPDAIYDKVDVFSELRTLRKQLNSDSEFEQAASVVHSWDASEVAQPPAGQSDRDQTADRDQPEAQPLDAAKQPEAAPNWPEEGKSLLDQILESPSSEKSERPKSAVDKIISEIVAPHAKPAPDARKPDLIRRVDDEIRKVMQQILLDPVFLKLESLWHVVEMLTRRIESDTKLSLYLINATQEQVRADVCGQVALNECNLYQNIVDQTVNVPGTTEWSLIISDFEFSADEQDIDMLGRLAKIAAAAGAPWFVSVGNTTVGFDSEKAGVPAASDNFSPSEAWSNLQSLQESKFLAAFWPRFLARAPYGRKSKPIDRFEFEEVDSPPSHHQFAWASGSLLGGFFACQAICQDGLSRAVQQAMTYDRLPFFVYGPKSDQQVQHASECLLFDKQARAISKLGINPLRPVRDTNSVVLEGIRSVNGEWLGT